MTIVYYYIKNNNISELSITPGNIVPELLQKSFKCSFELVENQKVFVIVNAKDRIVVNITLVENEINKYIDRSGINELDVAIFSTNICKYFIYR
jgi:hypothetical protein